MTRPAGRPTTEELVHALLVLGVEGPATAIDVLNVVALVLPGEQLVKVLDGVKTPAAPEPGS